MSACHRKCWPTLLLYGVVATWQGVEHGSRVFYWTCWYRNGVMVPPGTLTFSSPFVVIWHATALIISVRVEDAKSSLANGAYTGKKAHCDSWRIVDSESSKRKPSCVCKTIHDPSPRKLYSMCNDCSGERENVQPLKQIRSGILSN